MGFVFEELCSQWLWRQYAGGALDFEFDDMGRWWGNDPDRRQEAEIDIVCTDGESVVALGECKWKSEAFPEGDLRKLIDRTRLVNVCLDARFYAFSRSGFTKGCVEYAAENSQVQLVGFNDMLVNA